MPTSKDLIDWLRQTNLGLADDDFEVLNGHGRTFLLLTEEKFEDRDVKLGPAMNIAYS